MKLKEAAFNIIYLGIPQIGVGSFQETKHTEMT